MTELARASDDLLVLERRGRLGVVERRRLEVFTRSSPVSRLMHELGREYDAMQTDREGDGELVARLAAAVCERRGRRPERRSRSRTVLFAFVLVLGAASAAVAGVGIARLVADEGRPDEAVPASNDEPGDAARGKARRGAHETAHAGSEADEKSTRVKPGATSNDDDEMRVEPVSRAPDGDVLSLRRDTALRRDAAPRHEATPQHETGAQRDTAPRHDVSSPDDASPERMFSKANAWRKAGRMGAAVQAYRELGRRHPGSAEALLSHVVLGRILLRQGDAPGALLEFSRYLGASPKGSLAEEALYGSATALRVLGRLGEEENVWRRLLARFPSSIYGEKARARLSELASGGGALGSRPEPSGKVDALRERRDGRP